MLATHASRCGAEIDTELLVYSMIAAVRYRVPDRDPLLLCALSRPGADIRVSALRTVGRTGDSLGDEVTARITELSTRDADASVRTEAERALARLR